MKGLFIGINYIGTENQLSGCINDIHNTINMYKKLYGLKTFRILTDDNKSDGMPTKINILQSLKWLISENKPGEQLFLHYSGHGTYITDKKGDETDKRDECIVPCDYESSDFISDDTFFTEVVAKVGKSYLFAVFDSCHSGTIFDLNYTYASSGTLRKINNNKNYSDSLNIVVLSGCYDIQTSADTTEKINGKYMNCGALSWGLYYVLQVNPNITYRLLIDKIRTLLAKSKYEQIPQLSFNVFPMLDSKVVKGDATIIANKKDLCCDSSEKPEENSLIRFVKEMLV